ncbi:MAG: DUF5615 family PIN-like protein [Anaerolineae bacterium]|nr:DUF5615 family PIN-like protein [Anaerolineae bacterium]
MRGFLVDEGVDAIVVRTLRSLDIDTLFVAEISPGITDEEVLHWANSEQRVLVVEDRDFSELVFRDAKECYGLVYIRIRNEYRADKANQMRVLVKDHLNELVGYHAVVMRHRIRFRALKKHPNDQSSTDNLEE